MRRVVDRRRAVIKELVDATSHFASDQSQAVGPQVRRRLEETLEAAVADEQSAAILWAGRLKRPAGLHRLRRRHRNHPAPF